MQEHVDWVGEIEIIWAVTVRKPMLCCDEAQILSKFTGASSKEGLAGQTTATTVQLQTSK